MLFGQEHVRAYRESNGEVGHEWQDGVYTLLLTTTGRRSGEPYTTPLIYIEVDDGYAIVASKGGADDHPDWYRNLVADPTVEVQVGPEQFTATARTVDARERAQLWPRLTDVWPDYDDYVARTDREIPVVVLSPVD